MDKKKIQVEERFTGRAWYFVHTFSGYENKVQAAIKSKVTAQKLEDFIFDIIIPMHDESEFKNGKRRVVKRKLFPGNIMIDMIVNDKTWYTVRNTQGVTGFVGIEKNPIPLTEEEVQDIFDKMSGKQVEDDTLGFKVKDNVRIIDGGNFENRIGVIKSIDAAKQRVKVSIGNISLDLDAKQVEKI